MAKNTNPRPADRTQGINSKEGAGQIRPMSDAERVQGQIDRGEVRAGPQAAREIAQRIESEGGFWNHPDYQ